MLKLPFRKRSTKKYCLDAVLKSDVPAAYSLRRLRSSYNGPPVRVRRSSDNVEADIGFSGQDLDVAGLLVFVGAGNSGYVTIWYDQSGNGNHAVQTNSAYQPRIVNSGILDRDFDASKCAAQWPTFASAANATIISNGNFVNTTGWTANGCNISASSNTLSITGTGTTSAPRVYQLTSLACTTAKRLFVRITWRVTNSNCQYMRVDLDGSTGGGIASVAVSSPTQNQWYTTYGIYSLTASETGLLQPNPRHSYADAATANGKVMEIQEFVIIDITELGRPAPYFDGSNDVLGIDCALTTTTEPAYNAGTTYAIGDIVSSGGYVYVAIAATTGNAPTDTTKWRNKTLFERRNLDITTYPFMINAVFNSSNQNGCLISRNVSDGGASVQYGLVYDGTNAASGIQVEGSQRSGSGSGSLPFNTQKILSGVALSGAQNFYINGTIAGTAGTYSGSITSKPNMQIGARANNAAGTAWTIFFKGYIPEVIITTNTSARSKVEKNQGKYYSQAVA